MTVLERVANSEGLLNNKSCQVFVELFLNYCMCMLPNTVLTISTPCWSCCLWESNTTLWSCARYLESPLLHRIEFQFPWPKNRLQPQQPLYESPLHANHHLKKGNKTFPDRYVPFCVMCSQLKHSQPFHVVHFFSHTCQVIRVAVANGLCFVLPCNVLMEKDITKKQSTLICKVLVCILGRLLSKMFSKVKVLLQANNNFNNTQNQNWFLYVFLSLTFVFAPGTCGYYIV